MRRIEHEQVVDLTSEGLRHVHDGQELRVDLASCNRGWLEWKAAHRRQLVPVPRRAYRGPSDFDGGCVGFRDVGKLTFELLCEPRLQIAFPSREAFDAFRRRLAGAGWHTFDMA